MLSSSDIFFRKNLCFLSIHSVYHFFHGFLNKEEKEGIIFLSIRMDTSYPMLADIPM